MATGLQTVFSKVCCVELRMSAGECWGKELALKRILALGIM